MKKILIVTLAALLLFSLAACSVPAAQETPSTPPQADASADASGEAQAEPDAQPMQTIFGKVKSLVGNELTLDLAKQPEGGNAETGEDGEGYASFITNPAQSITVTEKADGGGEASGDTDVKIGYYAEDGSGDLKIIGGDDMPKLELEYTGETEDITIPAGLQIFDMFGKEVKMADLKEGNVLMVMQKEDGSIESIAVME